VTARSFNRSGYTLVEILVVLAIVALLASIAAVVALRSIQRSRQSRAMDDMRLMAQSLGIPLSMSGHYPDELPDLDRNKKDPWGNSYVYTGKREHYELRCLGADGEPSGGITLDQKDEFDLDIIMVDGQFTNAPH
jgi:prepilin-type N-terminal cleavage/methylation domain-containing protein